MKAKQIKRNAYRKLNFKLGNMGKYCIWSRTKVNSVLCSILYGVFKNLKRHESQKRVCNEFSLTHLTAGIFVLIVLK